MTKLEFSVKDVVERFKDLEMNQSGANNIQDEIAHYLLRTFRDTDIMVSDLWKSAEYIKERLGEDYLVIKRKWE